MSSSSTADVGAGASGIHVLGVGTGPIVIPDDLFSRFAVPGQSEELPWFVGASDKFATFVSRLPVVGDYVGSTVRVWLPGERELSCGGRDIFNIGGRIATKAATFGAITGAARGATGGFTLAVASPGAQAAAPPAGALGAYVGAHVGAVVSFFQGFAYGSAWGAVRGLRSWLLGGCDEPERRADNKRSVSVD